MEYTFWIAVIGCAIGAVSLGIEIARYLSERPRIQIRTCNELNNITLIEGNVVKNYLHLQILNTGTRHTLLQDVYLKRHGAKKNILENMVNVSRAYKYMPWKYCNNQKIADTPDIVHFPASIPPGGVFECVLLFIDVFRECYDTDESFIYPTLCVAFTPSTVREIEVQTILTSSDNEYCYADSEGRKWSFRITEIFESDQ